MSTAKTEYTIHPYLSFSGRCEEAIEFYRKAVGAEVFMLMRFKDAPPGSCPTTMPPEWSGKVMHARLRIGESVILVADGCAEKQEFQGISLSLTVPDPAEAHKVFAALEKGGHVQMPMSKTFFSPAFGMVKDPFGVLWAVYVEQAPAAP